MLYDQSSGNKRNDKFGSGDKPKDEGRNINNNTDNFSFGKLNEDDQGWKTSSFSDGPSRRKLEFTDGSEENRAKKPDALGNPFENYLDKTVPQREKPWIADRDKTKVEVPSCHTDLIAREVGDKLESHSDKTSVEKPPIRRTSSLSKIKKMEEKLNYTVKDNKELERIANIMKQDFSKSKNMYNFSSDSDS